MIEWAASLEARADAAQIALLFALFSAITHALFSMLQKGADDPFLIRASIDFWFLVSWLGPALFLIPWPTPREWLLILGIFPVHTAYKLTLASAYRHGDFSLIYPLARGSAPLFSGLAAGFVFGEYLGLLQWVGVLMIALMIMALGFEALPARREGREGNSDTATNGLGGHTRHPLLKPIALSLLTGVLIASYSIYDAYGVRESRSAFIFLAWFYVVDGFFFPLIAIFRRKTLRPVNGYGPLLLRGAIAAPLGILSFSSIFIAARFGHIGEIAALRETSVIFGAILGYFILRERVTPLRFSLIALIALGAALIEIGGA